MIPLLNECHDGIFIDNTLFELNVNQFYPDNVGTNKQARAEYAVRWMAGVCKANNLRMIADDIGFYVHALDMPGVRRIKTGPMTDEFRQAASKLKWDIIPYNGSYILEYPIGHQTLVDELLNDQVQGVSFTVLVNTYRESMQRDMGLSLSAFVDLNANFFDYITGAGSVASDLFKGIDQVPRFRGDQVQQDEGDLQRASLYVRYGKETIDRLRSTVRVVSLRGIVGREIKFRVGEDRPFTTVSRNREGEVVNQQRLKEETGFTVDIDSWETDPRGVVFEFNVTISEPLFNPVQGQETTTPAQVRQSTTTLQLQPGQLGEVVRMSSTKTTNQKRGGFFSWRNVNHGDDVETLLIMVRRER